MGGDTLKERNRTLILIKPRAFQKGQMGRIMTRYEDKGLECVAAKVLQADRQLLEAHYEDHKTKSFYEPLIQSMQQGPVFAAILEGTEAVEAVRQLNGATDPLDASPGTIRGDFGMNIRDNVVHASDSEENVLRELNLWFPELVENTL